MILTFYRFECFGGLQPLSLYQFYDLMGASGYLIVDNNEIKFILGGKLNFGGF
jgi:hypothetical protein